jgi:arabinose-5-phosphate isomerase
MQNASHPLIIEQAVKTIQIETEALQGLISQIGKGFALAVETILDASGRVVVTGIGKSAIIGQKIVATFNSTGTPAVFMHAADAIHGDLGMIQNGDVVICLSKSGNTPEIRALVPLLKQAGVPLIAIVGNLSSYLASHAGIVIAAFVSTEACPHDLAPTSSTTVQLVIGDALAICLLNARNFSANDFARYHPGGTLGKQLYLTAGELLLSQTAPEVSPEQGVSLIIQQITGSRTGATAVVKNGNVVGIITDGDIRRMLEKTSDLREIRASDIMNPSPKTIDAAVLAMEALQVMKQYQINQLIITENGMYKGILHLQEILREGLS